MSKLSLDDDKADNSNKAEPPPPVLSQIQTPEDKDWLHIILSLVPNETGSFQRGELISFAQSAAYPHTAPDPHTCGNSARRLTGLGLLHRSAPSSPDHMSRHWFWL
ncbi:hypothetical protein A4X13_0g6306 [Tilletia indica]|uniref:Uncharacterized protein n=1 Tax=Tilletia indica TaxID=43049 RepID=A0A177T6D9_9BASI|nr:hypothetical protein A4X13_0g6306 [Tilletia indica]